MKEFPSAENNFSSASNWFSGVCIQPPPLMLLMLINGHSKRPAKMICISTNQPTAGKILIWYDHQYASSRFSVRHHHVVLAIAQSGQKSCFYYMFDIDYNVTDIYHIY